MCVRRQTIEHDTPLCIAFRVGIDVMLIVNSVGNERGTRDIYNSKNGIITVTKTTVLSKQLVPTNSITANRAACKYSLEQLIGKPCN